MKRYLALIGIIVVSLISAIALFVFLIGQDNSYITYVKLQVNPSFVIGINDNEKVVFYNSLNEDGNKYNLGMFQGKGLDEAIRIFVNQLGPAKPLKDEINITIMTKNDEKEERIFKTITDVIKDFDNTYVIINHEPSPDDLERYSNETVYNLNASFKEDDLKRISKDIYQKVSLYIDKKFENLNLDSLSDEEKIQLIKEKQQEGYFNDLIINNIILEEADTKILEPTAYSVVINYNDDYTYDYRIILNLKIEHARMELKKIVEVYYFDYEEGEDLEIVNNLKKYYYTF